MTSRKCNSLFIFITASMLLSVSVLSSGRLIDLGEDRTMFMECQGVGSPTVVLISGYPDRGDASWETPFPGQGGTTVFSAVSRFTKVCNYDRPGTIKVVEDKLSVSRSDPVPQPVTSKDQVRDFHALIKAGNIEKPFIIVAHSAGGLIAKLYANEHPGDVSGFILIDVTTQHLKETWTPREMEVFSYSIQEGPRELLSVYKDAEVIDFDESFGQLEEYGGKTLNMPDVVLSAGKIPNAEQLTKDGTWPAFVTQDIANSIH